MSYKFKPEYYVKPQSTSKVIELMSRYGKDARIIAGGTDLLVNRPKDIKVLIDIKGLKLNYIKESNIGISIGATTPLNTLYYAPLFQTQPHKVVSDAAWELGHYNMRHLATVGGNICNAAPSADSAIALMALETQAVVVGQKGERKMPLWRFFKFVGEITLGSEEILKELLIPLQPKNTAASFQKIGRTKVDIALVNAACRLTLNRGLVEDTRIILGAVAPIPLRIIKAEKLLNGKEIQPELVEEVAETASEVSKPIDDVRSSASYRKKMSRVLVRRAIMDAYEKALKVSA